MDRFTSPSLDHLSIGGIVVGCSIPMGKFFLVAVRVQVKKVSQVDILINGQTLITEMDVPIGAKEIVADIMPLFGWPLNIGEDEIIEVKLKGRGACVEGIQLNGLMNYGEHETFAAPSLILNPKKESV